MACFHFNVKIISRGQGQSITAASAYMSGEKLRDIYDGRIHDRSYRQDVIRKEILLPPAAPDELYNRQTLLDALNLSERRSNAQMARNFKLALPCELTIDEQHKLVREFLNECFIKYGFCADLAIHQGTLNPDERSNGIKPVNNRMDNPHAHIIIPFRTVGEEGFHRTKLQSRSTNNLETLIRWREEWARLQNGEFIRLGLDVRVSHERLDMQGIDREPTKHIGAGALALERKGIRTERGDQYREIIQRNQQREYERQQRIERRFERVYELERSR